MSFPSAIEFIPRCLRILSEIGTLSKEIVGVSRTNVVKLTASASNASEQKSRLTVEGGRSAERRNTMSGADTDLPTCLEDSLSYHSIPS